MNSEALMRALSETSKMVEEYIEGAIDKEDKDIKTVTDSMRYSLLSGGKRIRPFLTLEFCRLFGGHNDASLSFAAAIEFIHTFSLIHDDLPCMDDDEMRRGKPTNHMVYGEATALLAGDALALHAFGMITENEKASAFARLNAVSVLSKASADMGMVGGQIIDMYGEENKLTFDVLLKLHSLKTGALIRASAVLGCLAADIPLNDERMTSAITYSENIGLAFQIIDDILDKEGNEALLGKPIGSDGENGKTTFLSFMSVEEARKYALDLTEKAKKAIEKYPGSETLIALADYLLYRDY